MFEKLIEFIKQWFDLLIPFTVLDPYERGVVLRLGKFHRKIDAGFSWVMPFNIETVLTDNVVPRTVNLSAQSLTTLDGVSVVVGAIVTASISNIRVALLDVEGVDDALKDSCLGVIGHKIASHTWEAIQRPEFVETLTSACAAQASDYGLKIKRVQLSDVARMRAVRLHIDQTTFYSPTS